MPSPPGAVLLPQGDAVNFALYSRFATGVTLLLYSASDPISPARSYPLDPARNKTGPIWHLQLSSEELAGARFYAYSVDGPWAPPTGHRFDKEKVLLDPFARRVYFPPGYDRQACARPGSTAGHAPLGVLPQPGEDEEWGEEDWGPAPPPRHGHDTIVYEMHVKGFTASSTSGIDPELRGTFRGVIEKIPYLKKLGVTVLELLPVQQYDPQEGNYWGYMTLNFFAPHAAYATSDAALEFKQMVKALHQADIEVWLDVVYNHSSEYNETGPTYSYRGLDNKTYYLLDPNDGSYRDYAGCGNVLHTAHAAVRTLIRHSVRYWADVMHVDGFRFDLASILSRNLRGNLRRHHPALIPELEDLAHEIDVVLVAEPWDLEAYQLGRSFPGRSWRQWNARFRDDIRSFLRGDAGQVPNAMRRLYGSNDLFPDTLEECYHPYQSINYLTAHDGFTLYDLVSYNQKHNQANGLDNKDGVEDNLSWNCGWEGDAGAPSQVMALRRQQARNFFALLMLAAGTPMFVAGDEFLRTQQGNNNAFNQDNPISWIDWSRLETEAEFFRFARLMIAFRKDHPSLGRNRFWGQDVRWHGVGPDADLSWGSRTFAFFLEGASHADDDLYVMVNAWTQPLVFTVQEGSPEEWLRVIDTAQPSPQDIAQPGDETRLAAALVLVNAHSLVVLRRSRSPEPPLVSGQ